MGLNIGQVIQLAFAIAGDVEELGNIGIPTQPIRAGNEWFTVTQVDAPKQLPGLASKPDDDDEPALHNPG